MIDVQPLGGDEWTVTVHARSVTKHRVRVTPSELERLGGKEVTAEDLLKASFRFLLDREPNTSIMSSFELPVISRYFPEYEKAISGYLGSPKE